MKMFCVTHKYLPGLNDRGVIPVFVGNGECPANWLRDDTSDNIHHKNPHYCELTAQYWVWKNLFPSMDADQIVGFCHYRRFFVSPGSLEVLGDLRRLDEAYLGELVEYKRLSGAEVILPAAILLDDPSLRRKISNIRQQLTKGIFRPQWIRTVFTDYRCVHDGEDLIAAVNLLEDPYRTDFWEYVNRSVKLHACNCYIASAEVFSSYFAILFPWLFRCQEVLPIREDAYQRRVFGFLAERFASFYFSSYHRFSEAPLVNIFRVDR